MHVTGRRSRRPVTMAAHPDRLGRHSTQDRIFRVSVGVDSRRRVDIRGADRESLLICHSDFYIGMRIDDCRSQVDSNAIPRDGLKGHKACLSNGRVHAVRLWRAARSEVRRRWTS
ncbi:hypothetical protein BCEP4_1180039 [Burkholderia cepacia]|nr:hypothetical protein BCEP4_1180039 [Burkholderia cepacia]